jgi:hypothetical protein
MKTIQLFFKTLAVITVFIMVLSLFNCKKNNPGNNDNTTRTYRMGFQVSAPSLDFDTAIMALNLWVERADAAIISVEVPWDSIFAGRTSEQYINYHFKNLVDFYRAKQLKLWVFIDPQNGLDRRIDAIALVNRNKSIAQPEMQKIYQRFAFCMDSILKPHHLGLALETNLIRGAAPDSIYQGVKTAANNAYTEIRNYDKNVKVSISIQADFAWGRLNNSGYLGIEQDFTDFPFIEELGISSYPYFGFENPSEIPINYYSRLIENKLIPVFISEGGWSSVKVEKYESSGNTQKNYITRNSELLDHVRAIAWFQLTFTDINISLFPASTPENLKYFAYIGLVDKHLLPKPALAAWDNIFNRQLISAE